MNIAFVITTLTGGGAERVASILCNEWRNKGHNITLILTSQHFCGEAEYYPLDKNIKVHELSHNIKKTIFFKIKETRKIFLLNQIQIVVTFLPNSSYIAQMAAKGMHIYSIVSERADPTHSNGISKYFLRRITFAKADRVVFQTYNVMNLFSKKIRSKSVVITNPSYTKPMQRKISYDKQIVAIGRLCPQKRYGYLINAFSIFLNAHDDYKLIIYGAGPSIDSIKKVIMDSGLNNRILLKGFVNNIEDSISSSSFFVMSSLYEGFPNSLLEACLLGLPCISSNFYSGGAEQLIKDGYNGFLVGTGDSPRVFSKKMEIMAENLDFFRDNSHKHAQILCNNHNPSYIADLWIKLFNEVLDKKR